jgi:hypothetical protein
MQSPCFKRPFSVLCFDGLRWSDIAHLTWEEVKENELDGWYLHFKQRKTSFTDYTAKERIAC